MRNTPVAFCCLTLLLFPATASQATMPELVSVTKIWERGEHNAFTDLIRFRGRWWCTFREAKGHARSLGKIRVLVSDNGEMWKPAALLEQDEIDLRDPKLSRTPDDRLMLMMGGATYEADGTYRSRTPRVSFSGDGRNWTQTKRLLSEDHWLWRVTWHKGIGYSVSKLGDGREPRRVMLYKTRNGIDWQWVTEFKGIPAWPNEATVRFLDNDEMIVLLRRNKTAWIGTSLPPYGDWSWKETGHRTGGPNFIRLPDGSLWASGRQYSAQGARTVLARMTRDNYEPALLLPSGGDCSYPGMVWHEGHLWMSYYSSHEGKTSIYLAKIKMPLGQTSSMSTQQTIAPIDVGTKKQLFIDERFMDERVGVDLVMNPPRRDGVVLIRADQPWESGPKTQIGVYSCVLKEGDLVRVWYFSSRSGDNLYQRVAYAESEDGLHFRKPILGLHEAVGSKENNIVLPGRIGGCSVWIDPNAPPEHRYKNQAKVYPSAKFHMHSSPDGLNWKFFSQIEPGHGGWDTQSIVFWDPRIQRYALYTRFWMSHRHKTAPAPNDYRTVRRLESDDLKNWEKQTLVMQPDDLDRAIQKTEPGRPPVNYYGADVFRYEEAEHVYIMLAQAFWQWQKREKKGLGPSGFDVRLSTSRDGVKFRRAGDRKPFMAMGPSGRFDSRGVWAMPNPIRMGDELWIYYVGSNRDHDDNIDPTADGKHLTGISRAVLRLDGFVSADAGYEGGQITTPPIRFAGQRLELNVDTSGSGSVVVEVLDTSAQPIAGYAASDAIAVNGNSVRMPVLWRGGDDVASLAGRDIRLRFYMRDCKLYAFQFRD